MELLIILLITLLNGVLAMTEAAFISARKSRLQQMADDGDSRARTTLDLMQDPNRFLSTTQIGITLIGILAGAFGGATIADQLARQIAQVAFLQPYAQPAALVLVALFTAYLSLVIGELVPKRIALNNPERTAAALVPAMRGLAALTAPVVRLLSFSTNVMLQLIGARPPNEPPISNAEIQALMQQGIEAGVFEAGEQEMVAGVLELDERRVDMMMTPRTEIEWLDADDPLEANLRKLIASDHSRFPVAHGSLDRVLGVVRAKDLLTRSLNGQPFDLKACLTKPLFIPESVTVAHALGLFKETSQHFALVIGEYGGVEGLVTLNDLIEEIVGDIEDPAAVQREDGSWLLDGLMTVDDLKDLLDVKELPNEDEGHYQTLGGFVMAQLGRIPAAADHFACAGYRFEVMDMDGKRVDKVLVTLLPPAVPDPPEEGY
jgi:putative hemolysin